jgi:hypothetical protein
MIGSAQSLRTGYLVIQTLIDFGTIDSSQWEQLIQNLVIKYDLSGGLSGNQHFNSDTDDITTSPNKKLVIVAKPIELI